MTFTELINGVKKNELNIDKAKGNMNLLSGVLTNGVVLTPQSAQAEADLLTFLSEYNLKNKEQILALRGSQVQSIVNNIKEVL